LTVIENLQQHDLSGGEFRLRASQFESLHPTALHLLIAGAGWATYLWDHEDVVWRLIHDSPSRRLLEHVIFSCATVLIGAGAVLCTRSRAPMDMAESDGKDLSSSRLVGEWLYAIGLATLLPLLGSILLVVGESIRIVRLALRGKAQAKRTARGMECTSKELWAKAVRRESAKYGILLTMMVFSVCLIDRVADYGILASILAWGILSACEKHVRAVTSGG
jgi:hypothetical protein